MLMYEGTTIPYTATPGFFFCPFGVYEDEELENELSKYDPNDAADREYLIRHYCLATMKKESYRHRWAKFHAVEVALRDKNCDFGEIIDRMEDDYFVFPWDWEI